MFETTRVTLGDLTFDVHTAGPVDGTPVVLLHGFPETARSWESVAPQLAEAGLRVLAPDQRGYSPGARPDGVAAYTVDLLVGDVVGLLDATGLDRAHLVGHDWGAAVAWQVAAHHPDRITTLTAVSVPHPAAYGWALREDADQQARAAYIKLLRQEGKAEHVLLEDDARRLRAMYGDRVSSESIDEYVRVLSEPGALTATLNWYRAMTREFAELAPVRVPTTYVWSTADSALGRAGAERCGEFVDAPYEFVVLDDVSHWVPEEAPDALAKAILARIDDRP
ncbi:alpha/beta hydrolase [Rhodococcus ruber]|uniref:Putative alpha/beta hydrolase n=1 Tax=Rhodococcus ruber TaxID=1830 RepID=A0A098BIH3_9NOCA|nr:MULTISPECIES: alpha/beta hydrolase [Rhodococcus]MDO2378242.1 alpha/beta hydrolase [Rhodococcus ruber]RIK08909.1 MAG: alpha/beta hydrolase [Acidobacteriota bacterium]ATQ31719.1 alpha/beta hydrolase [Rhodococcus ruber]AUM19727.1 alpha/beta hydrolase [Rhodococcus ruber]MBD8056211.1 alpha/beta hydrolase [Rhodococcus ruber]